MSFFLSLVRGLLTSIGVFLIVVGVATVFGKPQAEEAFRRSVEAELTEAFGVPVGVEDVHLSLLRRSIRMDFVEVSNPSLFRDEPAFVGERVVVKVDPLSLFTRAPRLHRVEVIGATMNYRYKVGTGTNIGLLTESLERYAAAHSTDRQYRVALLEATGAKVNFSTNLVPLAKVGMRVVDVRRENLDESAPLSDTQVARVMLLSIIKEAVTLHGIVDPLVHELKELFE